MAVNSNFIIHNASEWHLVFTVQNHNGDFNLSVNNMKLNECMVIHEHKLQFEELPEPEFQFHKYFKKFVAWK